MSAAECLVPPDRIEAIGEALRRARREPALPYPWEGLEGRLAGGGLPLVGYGSLVNAASAALTFGDEIAAALEPVVAFGGRRVFDYEMRRIPPRYACPAGPRERAALNVRPVDDPREAFNGVRLVLSPEALAAFRTREHGYDLVPFVVLPWADLAAEPEVAFGLACPRATLDVEPHPRYVEVCREGAAAFGEDFLAFFEATTFLADGTTPMEREP